MFDFFITLFGGLYYGRKYLNERSKDSNANKRIGDYNILRTDIESKLSASYHEEKQTKEYILSGNNFEEICKRFSSDFEFVFGELWQEVLQIPPRPPVLDPKIYKNDATSFCIPNNHIYWVYALLLASQGKIDQWMLSNGYLIGGIEDSDIHIKFAQCIEKHLRKYNPSIALVLEKQRDYITPERPYGGCLKVQQLCLYPTYRLW